MYVAIHTVAYRRELACTRKTLQYLMGHSDINVTMNTYTLLGLEDAVKQEKAPTAANRSGFARIK